MRLGEGSLRGTRARCKCSLLGFPAAEARERLSQSAGLFNGREDRCEDAFSQTGRCCLAPRNRGVLLEWMW